MTIALLDGIGFFLLIVLLFLPVFWWGACYLWQLVGLSKSGALDEKIYLKDMTEVSQKEENLGIDRKAA